MVWFFAINSLALVGKVWFLTAGPVVCMPMILTELPETKNCGSFFEKHNCDELVQFFDIWSRFSSCLHLAVGRHHRRRTSRCRHGLKLSNVKVSLADQLSFFRLLYWCNRQYILHRGWIECSFVLWACIFFFWQDSMPCLGLIAAVVQSLHGTCP